MNPGQTRNPNWIHMAQLEEYMDADFLKLAFLLKGDHITGVKLFPNKAKKYQKRGFAYGFAEFPDPVSAHMALVKHNGTLIPGSEPPIHFNLNFAGYGPKELKNHMHRLNVHNLDQNIDNMQLFQVVSQLYQSCFLAKVIRHPHTDISKGYGYLLFLDATERDNAVKRMNGMHIGGKQIEVSVVAMTAESEKNVPVPTRGEYELKVTRLDPIVSNIDLFQAFSKYPSCLSASILMDTMPGQSTHSGSVLFSDLYERNLARVEMNGVQVGREVIQTLLKPDTAADNSKSPAHRLHVQWLSKSVTNMELRQVFASKYRSVIFAAVRQNTTNEDKNMGYVLFWNMEDKNRALVEMNGYIIGGQPIKTCDGGPPKTPTTNVQAARVPYKINVKEMAMNVNENLLHETFACRYKSCVLARVTPHPSGKRRWGFVLFTDLDEKNQALVEMAGFAIAGKPIKISDGTMQIGLKGIDRTVPVANTESQQLQLKTTVEAKTNRWGPENPPIQQQRPPEVKADDEEKDYGADGTNKILEKIQKLINTKLAARKDDHKSAVDRPVVGQQAKRAVTRPPAAAAGRAEVWDDSTAGIQESHHGWAPGNDAGLGRDVVEETEEVWERSSSSSQEYSPRIPIDIQDDWSPAPKLEQPPRSQLSHYAGVLEELLAEGATLNEELITVISGILKENSPDRDEWAPGRRKRQGSPPHDDEWRDSGMKRQRNAPHGQSEPGSMRRANPYGPGELIPRGSHQRGPREWNQAPYPEQWGT